MEREREESPCLIVAKWNSDELSLLRGKGDGDVQVRGLSVLINATAISSASSIRKEPGGPSIVQMDFISSEPGRDWRYYICSFLGVSAAFMSVPLSS